MINNLRENYTPLDVLVSGPKFCGKTTTCERFVKSETKLITTNAIRLDKADPQSCLIGEEPYLIDEWQKVPELWNLIKCDLDDDYQFGKYIIIGSTTPIDTEEIQHSGAIPSVAFEAEKHANPQPEQSQFAWVHIKYTKLSYACHSLCVLFMHWQSLQKVHSSFLCLNLQGEKRPRHDIITL